MHFQVKVDTIFPRVVQGDTAVVGGVGHTGVLDAQLPPVGHDLYVGVADDVKQHVIAQPLDLGHGDAGDGTVDNHGVVHYHLRVDVNAPAVNEWRHCQWTQCGHGLVIR